MKTVTHLALLALLAFLALAFLASTVTPGNSVKPHQSTAHTTTTSTATADSSVFGAPSISAQLINNVLCSASSPACGTGGALYDYGKQYGIDPAYALAFFQHESGYGKHGIANSNRSLGNIRCSAGYTCKHGFRAYGSWQESYQDWYKLITWYVRDLGKQTLRQILYTYAPPVENSTDGYIQAVCNAVNGWRRS